jgi:hypothetical protein
MHGQFIIADISGYTQFLSEGELEHAHEIVGELLNSIIAAIDAPLTVSRIEGDAVFLYGETPPDVYGQTVLETVESLYVSFSSALENMVLNTTCDCNACANINGLGLKIVMHCGEFVKTNVGDTETLTGSDVITVHRLLKNTVQKATGIADYLLITQACVEDLGLERIVATWTKHTEEYEHIGEVTGYVSSLKDVWEFVRQQRAIKVLEGDSWLTHQGYSGAPPAIVWDHLIDPRKRNTWSDADSSDLVGDTGGRVGPGSEYHCAHGETIAVFTVLDTRPNEYMTIMIPLAGGAAVRYTHYLIPSGAGTRIVTYMARPTRADSGDDSKLPVDEIRSELQANMDAGVSRLIEMADDAAASLART